jgi:hypothetical protein
MHFITLADLTRHVNEVHNEVGISDDHVQAAMHTIGLTRYDDITADDLGNIVDLTVELATGTATKIVDTDAVVHVALPWKTALASAARDVAVWMAVEGPACGDWTMFQMRVVDDAETGVYLHPPQGMVRRRDDLVLVRLLA